MSTNIQIDVLLQRLKQVSNQTAQQNRTEKQDREDALLFEQQQNLLQLPSPQVAKQRLEAARSDVLGRAENVARFKRGEERSAVPDLYKKKRPAAQRLSVGTVFGVTYSFDGDPNDQRASKLRVGTTDFAQVAEIGGIFDPGRVLINDVTLPASGNNGTVVEAVGGLQYFDSFFTKPYQAWSGLTSTGGGAPPLLYEGTVPPPLTSTVDVWTASFDTFNGNGSAVLILPAGGQKCVFIYVHNKIKLFNTFRRIRRRLREAENPRPVPDSDLAPGITNGTYYDLRTSELTVFDYVDTQKFEAYEIFAFLVSPQGVRAINLPSATLAYVQALFPPITQNSTANKVVQSGGGSLAGYGPGNGGNFFFPIPGTSAPFPSVDQTVWRQSTTYGDFPTNNDVLAKQYGIGFIQSADHRGSFFSPAVYSYIKGDLNLQASDAQQYGAMRTQLNGVPPQKYIAPCVQSCNTDDTEFYSTTTTPFSINSSISPSLFKLERTYTVKKGEISDGSLYYCWDWDNPNFCTQQLRALGFTAADLQP